MTSKGGTGVGALLAILAIVAVGAFMFWLNRQAANLEEPEDVAVTDQPEAVAVEDLKGISGQAVVGRRAEFDSMRVAVGLGQATFAVALDDTTAYPILLNRDWIQRFQAMETRLYGGDMVAVHGQIFSLNDSIRAEWVNQGAVERGMAAEVPRTSTFILADSVVVY